MDGMHQHFIGKLMAKLHVIYKQSVGFGLIVLQGMKHNRCWVHTCQFKVTKVTINLRQLFLKRKIVVIIIKKLQHVNKFLRTDLV